MRAFKTFLYSTAMAIVTAGTAMSADLPIAPVAPVPVAAAFDWNGFYLGAHGGWGWASGDAKYNDSDFNEDCGPDEGFGCAVGLDPDGAFVGGQIGWNYVFGNGFMLGIEGDYSFASLSDSGEGHWDGFGSPTHVDLDVDQIATIQARAGWAMDRWLPFITLGWGWAHAERVAVNPVTLPGGKVSNDNWHNGFTIGAGTEYGIGENWSVKGEYRYFHGGEETYGSFAGGTEVDLNIHTLRFGVNYIF